MFGDPIFQNIEDNLDVLENKLLQNRNLPLDKRFNGWYRAVVEETNDPLQFRRVRVKVPELHNNDVKAEDLPWAIPAPWMGGINAGSWSAPMIGDIVFVCFEKNHPYAPIYCASADPTRRRMYSMWSIYTKSPQAVDQEGNPAETPSDFLEEYLPKDGRPMSSGLSDRYGNFLNFSAFGFAPKEHFIDPASVGTDALTKRDYSVNKDQPAFNDPDLKYVTMGTKYGHTAFLGDIGYKWFNEFKGDFEQDKQFEQDRYQYLLKYFNEQEPKDRDQRRIDIRTRLGHKFEMRDVGWDKSREGEYGDVQEIGDSKDRDERWIKIRSKGGHLFQLIDVGFDPDNDVFYKRLNKDEFGTETDEENELGEDKRMIRLVSRHGNMLVLDDRGSDPLDAQSKETPNGNGFLLRTRKGFQFQAVDKPEKDSLMIVSPKDQVFEINDRFQYLLMSTTQSGSVHTKINPTSMMSIDPSTGEEGSIYVEKTGQTNDPTSNTQHLILDKANSMIRLKDPDGAGIEIRGQDAPCGQWVETRDRDNRAIWMSPKDNMMIIRDKPGMKYILLDDNDDVILIRNEDGKIQIRAKDKLEIKCDEGDICLEAKGQIGLKAKKIAISTDGIQHVVDSRGIGTREKVFGKEFIATPRGEAPCKINDKLVTRKKPEDFDNERGCDDFKEQKGKIPTSVFNSPPGGGNGTGVPPGGPPFNPPLPSNTAPNQPGASDPIPPVIAPDPIEVIKSAGGASGNALWYGTTTEFLDNIKDSGLTITSLVNNLNIPTDLSADQLYLAKTLEVARSKSQAILAQKRYGGRSLILRIRVIPEGDLLSLVEKNNDVVSYKADLPFENNMEIYEEGTTEFTSSPLYTL